MDFSVPPVHYNAVTRKAHPSDVSDERRKYPLCNVSNGLRSMLRTGAPWRMLPTDCRRGTWWITRPSAG